MLSADWSDQHPTCKLYTVHPACPVGCRNKFGTALDLLFITHLQIIHPHICISTHPHITFSVPGTHTAAWLSCLKALNCYLLIRLSSLLVLLLAL
jgi:hypothetical protein